MASDIIYFVGYGILLVLLLPVALFVLAIPVEIARSTWWEPSTRRRWRRDVWDKLVAEQFEAGTSPLHRWVEQHPWPLFDGLIHVEAPRRTEQGRWRVGTLDGHSIELMMGDVDPVAVARGDSAVAIGWSAWTKRIAKRIVDERVRAPLESIEDEDQLITKLTQINPCLARRIDVPVPLGDDMLKLYRAVAPLLPCGAPTEKLGGEDLEAHRVAYYTRVWGEAAGPPPSELPAGRWRAATSFEESDYYLPENEDDAHWGDDESAMNVLLYNDGLRTLELRFAPHDGIQVLGCYENPLDFVKRAVLARAADQLERELSR